MADKPFKIRIETNKTNNKTKNHYIRFIDQILKSDMRYPMIESIPKIIYESEKSYVILRINNIKLYEYTSYNTEYNDNDNDNDNTAYNAMYNTMYNANIQKYKKFINDGPSKILWLYQPGKHDIWNNIWSSSE